MKRIIATAALLALMGIAVGISHENSPRKVTVNDQPTARLVTQPAPIAAPAPETTPAVTPETSDSDVSAETPAAPAFQTDSGTGPGSFSFTPTSTNWTVDYTYSGCGDQGIVFLVKMGSQTVSHSSPGDSGSDSFAGNGINPVTIRVAVPEDAQWSLSVN